MCLKSFCNFQGDKCQTIVNNSYNQNTVGGVEKFETVPNRFFKGLNLPWFKFAADLTDKNYPETIKAFSDWFKQLNSVGANLVRWWLHTDGSTNPDFDQHTGKVTGLNQEHRKRIKEVLDKAQENHISIEICLWSQLFDASHYWFCESGEQVQNILDRNERLIRDESFTRAYIDHALVPLVLDLKDHGALFGYDIWNEPEGMVLGWYKKSAGYKGTTLKKELTPHEVSKFVNLLAGAVRRNDPKAMVTVGSGTQYTDWYLDSALKNAGGDAMGTLTHYSFHWYPTNSGIELSPFHNDASHWKLDKPIIAGEFPAKGFKEPNRKYKIKESDLMSVAECYQALYKNGYLGGLSWKYLATDNDSNGSWIDAREGLKTIAINLK